MSDMDDGPISGVEDSRKLVVIGDGACGKTCLLHVFAHNNFPQDYVPTVFDNYVANVELDDQTIEMTLWDTAGQEDYAHIRPLSYDGADVFLICFSIDARDSFENVETKWYGELQKFCPKVPFVLVGCKADLRDEKTEQQVRSSEGENMAQKLGATSYVECSAKNNDNVQTVFRTAAQAALQHKRKGGCCTLL